MNTSYPKEIAQEAVHITFTILLNCCLRELDNSSLYEGTPKYDPVLKSYMSKANHKLHLKLDFPVDQVEVYAPIRYQSETLRHLYDFPVMERDLVSETIKEIDPNRLLDLITTHVKQQYPNADSENVKKRMQLSTEKITQFLQHFETTGQQFNKAKMTFIEAEQLFPAGHLLHPLTKGREGFTEPEVLKYAPETGGYFQLYYFLVHPDLVNEKTIENVLPSDFAKAELSEAIKGNKKVSDFLEKYPEWKVLPIHPWEAAHFKKQAIYDTLEKEGLLIDLGEWGKEYTATSSVRTVYNNESDYMYKFSLHVKITGAERVNHYHELYRGYQVSRLMQTAWGDTVKKDYPKIEFICDPGFISVSYDGNVLSSFSTSVRHNPFKTTTNGDDNNVCLLASLCQDSVLGNPSRIENVIQNASKQTGLSVKETSTVWFKQYIDILLDGVIKMFNKQGMFCEWHQQNTLVQLNDSYLPEKVFFRDNQSFLFRKSFEEQLNDIVPGLSENGKMFIPDDRLFNLLLHYFWVGNILGLVNAFGVNGLADEKVLLNILYEALEALQEEDESGLVKFILESRYWRVKGNLLTALNDIDCGGNPAGVTHINFPNVLHKRFFSEQLIHPKGKEIVYNRYFPKEDVTITLRPVDLENDLEMLHEWFHRDHAKAAWKMDWPLRELEAYYRTLLPGDGLYSYIGMANGEPTFNIEVYWPTRDILGDYYDVLPTDYGTHQFIAPVDPKKKYVSPSTQCMIDYVFAQSEVGKMVGEGAVDSRASMMNKAFHGFKIEKVIEMPHKTANLNFCYREWYWAKFPQNKDIEINPEAEHNLINQ
nr:GNAT family N-acetyltransferase [uncultured Flavobacterium sp.]